MSRTPDGAGKGDAPRPLGVTMEQFDNAWDRIFNKAKISEEIQKTIDQHKNENHEEECGK
jgi:hypothetical protein